MTRLKALCLLGGGGVVLAAFMVAGVAVGAAHVPLERVIALFTGQVADPGPLDRIIWDLRLPRALLAALVGAGLGVVGCLLQTTTRNDLADPFLFGLSAGAAAGAVLVITVTGNLLGIWTLPAAAFIGGMLAAATVLTLISRSRAMGPARLVLAGLAVSFLFMAITNFLVFAGDQRAAQTVLFWSLGGLGTARWDVLPVAAVGLAVILVYALMNHRRFDALLAGEETAETLGVDVKRLRRTSFLISAFATAAFVSLTGVIGFVGLMVPHLARRLVGPLHGALVPAAALIGACLLAASDMVARTILAPQELPIGIVTTCLGAGFVLMVLTKES